MNICYYHIVVKFFKIVIKLVNKLISLFNEKVDYFKKKESLEKISKHNTWNNVNKKLLELINAN